MRFGGEEDASYCLAVGDVDGDGRLDVIVGNVGSRNAVYVSGDSGFDEVLFGAPEGITYGVAVADLDGDGRLEIAAANSDGPNYLYVQVRGSERR